ncbi:hemolymph lipopolysaccharide-binding protein-like [Augochlora pura]
MWSFVSVVNCAILVCLPVIFAVPLVDDQETTVPNSQDSTGLEQHVPYAKNVSACNFTVPCHGSYPWPDELRNHHHYHNMIVQGMSCSCDLNARRLPLRDDYLVTPGIGMHKFHSRSVTWNEARRTCYEEGGHLAIINSNAEAGVLAGIFNRASSWVKGAAYPDEAFVGIHDLYEEGNWVTILGDTLPRTGFSTWSERWGGQPDNGGGSQNCGAFLREGTLDDVHCEACYPFFCEIPLVSPA